MAKIPDSLDTGLTAEEVLEAFDNALNNYPGTKSEVEEARGEYDNLGERLDEMSSDTPTPSIAAPAMDGTAAAGTSTDYARADHIHPSDTSKQDALTTAQLAAANSGIDSAKVEQIETNKNNILFNTNQGVKNLFNLTKVSGTYSTVVFTVNSDKTVTVNGTASPANSVFNLDNWTCTKAGKYVISGAPSGGSWAPSPNTYRIRVAVNAAWKGDDVGNGYALTLAVGDVVNLQINTSTSYTASNLVFRPMIALKSLYDADSTYQPYAMSNAELTAAIQALQAQLANQ